MHFKFKTKKSEVLKVFYNDLLANEKRKTYGTVSIGEFKDGTYKEYERTVRIDEIGRKFFTWNREVFYMDQFLAYSPAELIERVNSKDDDILPEDLCATLLRYGIDSLTLMIKTKKLEIVPHPYGGYISLNVYSNHEKPEDYTWIEYKFIEEHHRMPSNCYKLKLVPKKEEEYSIYPKEDFYVSDLMALLNKRKDLYQLVN